MQLIPAGDWELIIIVAQMPRNYRAIHMIAWNVARLHVFVKDIYCFSVSLTVYLDFPYITHSRYFASPEGFPYSGDVWFDSGDVVLTREM